MTTFTTIVTVCSGISVIIGLLVMLVKPIREKVLKTKEHEDAQNQAIKSISDKVDDLAESIKSVGDRQDLDNAKRSRTQILRFADEIYHGTFHSQEHFDDILDSITEYNRYCEEHPDFKNKRTEHAQKTIEQTYDECKQKHSFL